MSIEWPERQGAPQTWPENQDPSQYRVDVYGQRQLLLEEAEEDSQEAQEAPPEESGDEDEDFPVTAVLEPLEDEDDGTCDGVRAGGSDCHRLAGAGGFCWQHRDQG